MFEEFKSKLVTGILSSPVIYVPTSDFFFVDLALRSVLTPHPQGISATGLDIGSVLELDNVLGPVDFVTKEPLSDCESMASLPDLLRTVVTDGPGGYAILLFKNMARLLDDPVNSSLLHLYATLCEKRRFDCRQTIIIADPAPASALPGGIRDIATVIETGVPDTDEIMQLVSSADISGQSQLAEESVRLELSRNLQGLGYADIRQILRSTVVRTGGRLSRRTIALALEEKKQIVRKTGIIEVKDTDEKFDNIGGLEVLISAIRAKKTIFDHLTLAQSRRAMVPLPKGVLIIGMPGCGKSMIAKAIASEFGVALLRLDINRLMGKYVGESETNLRQALETAEAAHPCVLWIDEIEKAFAGTDSGNNDIIVRLMGHFLTWMQERRSAVYVVATANDALKPELMRKGRFDDVFFVDFPDRDEACSILSKTLAPYRDAELYDWSDITDGVVGDIVGRMFKGAPHGFSGAEISSLAGTVVEDAFREYVTALEHLDGTGKTPEAVKITKEHFERVVDAMAPHVMSRQLDSKNDSAIKRIKALQATHGLKSASLKK